MNPVTVFILKIFIYPIGALYNLGFILWLSYYSVRHFGNKFWKLKQRTDPPISLMNTRWGKHAYAQLKNKKIHYVENGDQRNPLILMIHGFPEFWYSWRYQLENLSKEYWVVAIDLPGYGKSEKLKSKSTYKISSLIEDIKEFIELLGKEKVILVGHDWGGLLVWNFVELHEDIVNNYIILNCPHPRSFLKVLATDIIQFIMSWYAFFFQYPYLPELGLYMDDFKIFNKMRIYNKNINVNFSEEDLEAYKYTFSQKDALKIAVDYYRVNCGNLYIKDKYPTINIPGLLIFSEHDEWLRLIFLQKAKQIVSNLQTYVMKNSNHFVQQEHPKEISDLIKSHLLGNLKMENSL